MDEPIFALSIGSIVGGATPTNRVWRDGVDSLTRRIAAARGDLSAPLNVNVVFQIPGDVLRPDFEGVRTGSFARKYSLLMVQAAVPFYAPDNPEGYLVETTYRAIEEARRWAEKRRIAADIHLLREIVSRAARIAAP